MEEVKKKILEVVSKRDYGKGLEYEESYIDYVNLTTFFQKKRFQFLVESEHSYRKYMVQIEIDGREISDTYCTCPQFQNTNSCKHIAACLIIYSDGILKSSKDSAEKKSQQILNKLKIIQLKILI